MKRPGNLVVALAVVLAITAITTATAQATSAPYWSINGTRLAAGQTHNITAKAIAPGVFTIPALGVKFECKKLSLKEGVLLGSNENNPGKNNEVILFEECILTEGLPGCRLVTTGGEEKSLTTNSLTSELVERNETGKPKILLTEFFPTKAPTFITLHFEGTECKTTSAAVNGQVAAEVTTDNKAEETVELGQAAKQATSWNLRSPATPITHVILVAGGVASEKTLETLEFEGDPAEGTGTALVLLANAEKHTEESALWSPLP
jgi:hypothetical protein